MNEPQAGVAVILAAGRGLRLRPRTDVIPKALVPVAGASILDRILDAFRKATPVRRFILVTGYRADAFSTVRAPDGCTLECVENPQWENTNSMYSLALCARELAQGGYIVEGDCCFDHELFSGQAGQPADRALWFVRPFGAEDDGCCLQADDSGAIHTLSIVTKSSPPSKGGDTEGVAGAGAGAWKSCGVVRVSSRLGAQLEGWLAAAVQAGRQKQYYDLILADHLPAAALHVARIGAARWWEVDNEADLQRAERIFGA